MTLLIVLFIVEEREVKKQITVSSSLCILSLAVKVQNMGTVFMKANFKFKSN